MKMDKQGILKKKSNGKIKLYQDENEKFEWTKRLYSATYIVQSMLVFFIITCNSNS